MGREAERKIVQNAIFHGKRHDNQILKVKNLSSRNFVVMAQAPTNPKSPPPPKTRNFMDMEVVLQKEHRNSRRP